MEGEKEKDLEEMFEQPTLGSRLATGNGKQGFGEERREKGRGFGGFSSRPATLQ